MGTSSDPRLSKKVGRFYCGRFAVRTLRIQDATDRMTAWLSDPEALEILNVPARRLTKTDIANHIRGFDQRTHLLDGFMGGGQIGYNWQLSPIWVAGLEADFQGALERANSNLSNPFSTTTTGGVTTLTVTGASVTNYTTQIDWFGTVRGRLGYVWGNGEVMSYLTGGLAYGEVKIHGTNTVSGFLNNTPEFSVIQTFGHSQVNTGWVVGYGTEGHLTGNWTWKIEGLYMDLGHVDTVGVTSGVFISDVTSKATGGGVTSNSHFTDGILRAGLNYKFY